MKPLRIYISGPMSGLEKSEYRRRFNEAEQRILALAERSGCHIKVENPAKFKLVNWLYPIIGYRLTMIYDLWRLSRCHAIYMLDGWEQSNGANIEKKNAIARKLPVFYEAWTDQMLARNISLRGVGDAIKVVGKCIMPPPQPVASLHHEPTGVNISVYKPIPWFQRIMLRWCFGLKYRNGAEDHRRSHRKHRHRHKAPAHPDGQNQEGDGRLHLRGGQHHPRAGTPRPAARRGRRIATRRRADLS